MRALRTLLSALCIILGAIAIVAWAVSSVAVSAVKDGTVVVAVAEQAMESPAVLRSIGTEISDNTIDSLDESGIDAEALGLDGVIRGAIDRGVRSEAFKQTVLDQVEDAHGQVTEQLTDPSRAPGPLVLSVDVSDSVNTRIDEVAGVGALAPDIAVPPLQFEAVDAETFEDARTSYRAMEQVQRWGLWVGLALLAIGFLVSHRRRWFVAKLALAIAVIALAVWAAVEVMGPEAIEPFLPGGRDGTPASLVRDVLTDETAGAVAARALWVGVGAAVVAAIAAGLAGALRPRRH